MARNSKPTRDAVEVLHRRYFEGKPAMLALLEEERVNADVAQQIYDLRTAAGLTQKDLAQRVGTTPPVISRLEDANYGGHSLRMLQRIAAALGSRVEVRFATAKSARGRATAEAARGEGVRAPKRGKAGQ